MLSGECEINVTANEDTMDARKRSINLTNRLAQLCEQPVMDIYLYPSADDSSVSTLGSIRSHTLRQVVSRKIPLLKGTWDDGDIVEVSGNTNYIPRISHKIPILKGTWSDGSIVQVSHDTN